MLKPTLSTSIYALMYLLFTEWKANILIKFNEVGKAVNKVEINS